MTKQDFIELGLEEEVAIKCEVASLTELENFVAKADYDTIEADLQASGENFKKQLHTIKVEHAVDIALRNANAINPKTVMPLLVGLDDAEFDERGEIVGLNEQIKKLISGEDTKFLFKVDALPKIVGATIGESCDFDDAGNASYETIAKMLSQNPNLVI